MAHVVQTFIILVSILHVLLPDVLGLPISSEAQYFIQSPSNVTVSEGSMARLTCKVANKVGECQWTRDGFALGTDKQLPESRRKTSC